MIRRPRRVSLSGAILGDSRPVAFRHHPRGAGSSDWAGCAADRGVTAEASRASKPLRADRPSVSRASSRARSQDADVLEVPDCVGVRSIRRGFGGFRRWAEMASKLVPERGDLGVESLDPSVLDFEKVGDIALKLAEHADNFITRRVATAADRLDDHRDHRPALIRRDLATIPGDDGGQARGRRTFEPDGEARVAPRSGHRHRRGSRLREPARHSRMSDH